MDSFPGLEQPDELIDFVLISIYISTFLEEQSILWALF